LGFLGREVVRALTTAGHIVRATDRAPGADLFLPDFRPADILREESVAGLFDDVSSVVHVAGLAHVFDRPSAASAPFMAVNAEGTERVARLAAQAGVRRFVLISSVSVYGIGKEAVTTEDSPCLPKSPYALSKLVAEQRAAEVASRTGMAVTILRLATLYGEEDPGNLLRLLKSVDSGRFRWVGSGTNRKSLLYRGDAASACVAALGGSATGVRVYNVTAAPCTMREIVEGMAAALERPVPRARVPAAPVLWGAAGLSHLPLIGGRFAGLHDTLLKWLAEDAYDGSRFAMECRFTPQMPLREGLRREAAWFRSGMQV
jgi:nucleoside-diphosphate-sugar epimerase